MLGSNKSIITLESRTIETHYELNMHLATPNIMACGTMSIEDSVHIGSKSCMMHRTAAAIQAGMDSRKSTTDGLQYRLEGERDPQSASADRPSNMTGCG